MRLMAVGQVLHTKCSTQCLSADDRVGDTAADQLSVKSVLVGLKPEFMPRFSKKLHRGLFLNFINAQTVNTVSMNIKYGQEATGMGQPGGAQLKDGDRERTGQEACEEQEQECDKQLLQKSTLWVPDADS
ncbi:hypothetical protein LXL04_013874 [Taraxacum kok-saghyz]